MKHLVLQGFLFATVLLCCAVPGSARADASQLTLSVTPPLYQLNVAPGDLWKSTLKVINSNPYELTVYAEVYTFVPKGEDGQGSFIPRAGGFNPEGPLLSNWLEVTTEAIVIPPEQSMDVPVTMMVPQGASPGGHFAALLVGTRPPDATGESIVRTSQVVTSLLFLRVAGDVVETGSIREFSVANLFRESPDASFVLRFENTGNVHLQPQGDITIYNMWGKERGVIPINQRSHFGNVLPQSIRRFEFTWRGESSLSDIGRYTASVTLAFGEEGRQNISQNTYFWVVPVKGALAVLAVFGAFIYFIIWAVRRYVRRALYLAGYIPQVVTSVSTPAQTVAQARRQVVKKNLALPLREGVLDLRTRMGKPDAHATILQSFVSFLRNYRLFFLSVVLLVGFATFGIYYFTDVLRGQKTYEITVERGDNAVTLSSEEVLKEKLRNDQVSVHVASSTQKYSLSVFNQTTTAGLGATYAVRLEELGYTITSLSQQSDVPRDTSVIIYDSALKEVALALSQKLGNIAVSATESSDATVQGIRLYLGKDMVE